MRRVNHFLDVKQVEFLEDLPGTISEHIRRAVEQYIDKVKGDKSSASLSKKVGDLDA